jgi:hypothetical protein
MGGKKKTASAAAATSSTIPGSSSTTVTTTPAAPQPAVLAGQSGLAIHPSHGMRTIQTAARTVQNARSGTTLGGFSGSSHGGYGGSSTYTTSTGMKEGGWSYNAAGYRTTANKGSARAGYSPAASKSISSGKGGLY